MNSTKNARLFGLLMFVCLVRADITLGYNPPTDEAGPLRVTIQGPSELRQIDEPLSVVVELTNLGDKVLEGRLRLSVIDQWSSEPAEAVDFRLAPRGESKRNFIVRAAEGTYNAHYPIHAFADFTLDGQSYTAHPILILEAKHARSPSTPSTVPWKPVQLADDSTVALWELVTRRVVFQVFGEEAQRYNVGRLGSEPRSRADVSLSVQTLEGQARSVVAMHPPWSDGLAGTIAIEYPLVLPESDRIVLRCANAMNPGGQSDGVTFRVRIAPLADESALGTVVTEHHVAAKRWNEMTVDLTRFAGQQVRLQLESHPGPSNNTGWDRCFWAEPTLVLGSPPKARPFPPVQERGSQQLGTVKGDGVGYPVRIWPGRRGLLDTTIKIGAGDKAVYVQGLEVTVMAARLDQPSCPFQLTQAEWQRQGDTTEVSHHFESPFGSFDLVGTLVVQSASIQLGFALANAPAAQPWFQPRIEEVALARWSKPVERIYAGAGNVLVKPRAYQLSFDGHRLSTSFVGYDFADGLSLVEATDAPPLRLDVRPQQQHTSLHVAGTQTRTLIPRENVWTGVRAWRSINGLDAAPGVQHAAGRFVFDLWGGRYADSAEDLARAFRYGLTDALVVWHNWQRWGYDYRLPEIYPPNPRFGTHDELKSMIDQCRDAGVLFALHDNYIDYYPDAAGFSYRDKIAFRQDGTPVSAWLNEGRDAQSYRYRSDRVEPILKNNLRLIDKGLSPTAYFIDVWSSVRPYEYWSADGDYFSARYSRDTWGQLFCWIRDELGDGAPQISESGHDQLIGSLDGAQTNHLRVGQPLPGRYSWSVWNWECADAERIAWFDAAHHDRFALHGAGYQSRYTAGLDTRLHGMYSDDYITTEMLTGHPAMVSRPFGPDVVRKYWLTHDVARALALRTIQRVTFVDDDIHRQHVLWSGGGRVWINRGNSDWQVQGVTLPQYGFLARVPGDMGEVMAAIERRNGLIVERSESESLVYVNARSPRQRALPIDLEVQDVRYLGNRRFDLPLVWNTDVTIPEGWVPFLHFCDQQGEIVFQGTWQQDATQCTIPEQCRPGETFELCFGIYQPSTGRRLTIAGPDMGDRRIRLGQISLEGSGGELTGVTWIPYDPANDPVLQRQNVHQRVVDFGAVTTPGACKLQCEGNKLVVTLLPSDAPAKFDVSIRWSALPWKLPFPTSVRAVDEQGRVLSKQPVELRDGTLRLVCDAQVFAYELAP